jgi:glutamate/tyrosine decarboxylase-like PLP-dependent enzyme
LGLACGREAVIRKRLPRHEEQKAVGEIGLLAACAKAKVREIQILTTMGHSSLYKAASVVGLGRASVIDLPLSSEEPWRMDTHKLEEALKRSEHGIVSIVALSAGEVNTGRFATDGLHKMTRIRELCDKYGAWLHVDGGISNL